MGWIIVTILSFLFFLWFVHEPRMIKDGRNNRKPIGFKIWVLIIIIILSIIPIINFIMVCISIIWMFLIVGMDDVEWSEIFPPKPLEQRSKLWKILNKDLRK